MIFCPENCEGLSLTEAEQVRMPDGEKKKHLCIIHKVKLQHGSFHPNILRAVQCDRKDAYEQASQRDTACGKALQKDLKCPHCKTPLQAEVKQSTYTWRCSECDYTINEP